MITEPDAISLFCLLILYVFSFNSITPLCPYYVCFNPIIIIIIIIFSVDGHHLAFFIGQNIIIVSFAITKNVNANLSGNLYGATYFFPRSLRSLDI